MVRTPTPRTLSVRGQRAFEVVYSELTFSFDLAVIRAELLAVQRSPPQSRLVLRGRSPLSATAYVRWGLVAPCGTPGFVDCSQIARFDI